MHKANGLSCHNLVSDWAQSVPNSEICLTQEGRPEMIAGIVGMKDIKLLFELNCHSGVILLLIFNCDGWN